MIISDVVVGIYGIHDKEADRWYVGQAKNIKQRWKEHSVNLKYKKHPNTYLQNAWDSYGRELFEFVVLEQHDEFDCEYITERERFWMNNFGYPNRSKCFNVRDADLKSPISEETRKKLSLAQTGKKLSEETKRKMSVARTGKKSSDESRLRMSKAQKGRKVSDETRKKISLVGRGRIFSEEARKNISLGHTGIKATDETKLKMSEARKLWWMNRSLAI
jgi:group I intron endonuclease